DADVGLEPCQLQEMRPGLAFERICRDAVDDDASDPSVHGDALDTSRMAKGRGERALQTLARELRPPHAHGEPDSDREDDQEEQQGARGVAEIAPEPSTSPRAAAHGPPSIPAGSRPRMAAGQLTGGREGSSREAAPEGGTR